MTIAKSLLNSKVARASAWVMGGFAFRQGMRLVSNLILTRLLVPEYFGLMAIVISTLFVMTMLTDIGISRSVINHDEDDEHFLQTAWTLQVLHNVVIGLVTIAVAYPLAMLYGEQDLVLLLVIAGAAICFKGFGSLGSLLAEKAVKPKANIIIAIASQGISTIVMLIAAYYMRNVYALVIGSVLDIFIKVGLSYLMFDKHYCQFRLDRKAVSEIFSFGKWIMLSSALTTLVTQADAMIIGVWMPMEKLGKYAVASVFSGALTLVLYAVSASVLHPRYRELDGTPEGLMQIKKIRLTIMLLFACGGLFLAFGGGFIIDTLYDDRYTEAGWMLEVLGFGKIAACMSATILPLLLARGDSYTAMVANFWGSIILIACLYTCFSFYGSNGLILAYALSPFISHLAVLVLAKHLNFNFFLTDLSLLALVFLCAGLGWWAFDLGIFKLLNTIPSS